MTDTYKPEGMMGATPENKEALASPEALERAGRAGRILEAPVLLCDSRMRLHVDLGCMRGIIAREEAVWCRPGEGIKDIAIITRVGKPVAFKVLGFGEENGERVALLSRRAAQEECATAFLRGLLPGDVIPARVTHLENYGAFVDVGCGIASLLSIDCISVSRISHPRVALPAPPDWGQALQKRRKTQYCARAPLPFAPAQSGRRSPPTCQAAPSWLQKCASARYQCFLPPPVWAYRRPAARGGERCGKPRCSR